MDRSGNPVEFSLDSNGDLIFDENTTSRLLGTKAAMNRTFTTPTLSKTFEGSGCEMTVGAMLNLGMKAALVIVHDEFQYIHMVCNPKIEINTSFSLKGSAELSESFHFITLKFGRTYGDDDKLALTPEVELSRVISWCSNLLVYFIRLLFDIMVDYS